MVNLFNQKNSKQIEEKLKNKIYSLYNDEDEEHIIYIKNKIYSYTLTYYSDNLDNIYISDIYVKPKYRRKNFGNLLLDDAFQRVKNLKFKNLFTKVNKYSFECDWLKRKGFVFSSNLNKSDSDSKIIYCWFKKCF